MHETITQAVFLSELLLAAFFLSQLPKLTGTQIQNMLITLLTKYNDHIIFLATEFLDKAKINTISVPFFTPLQVLYEIQLMHFMYTVYAI